MTDILLIHGYGAGSLCPPLKVTQRLVEHNGFTGFKDIVEQKKAKVFKWYTENDFSLLGYLNLFKQYKIYRHEQTRARSKETIERLHKTVEIEKPKTMLAFSLGSELLFNYLEVYTAYDSLHYIITVQADLPRNYKIKNPHLKKQLQSGAVKWINYYCPWDSLLPASIVLNKAIPSGILGNKNPLCTNKLFPLSLQVSTHTGSITSEKFKDEVLTVLELG
jgi:hypothetical protein